MKKITRILILLSILFSTRIQAQDVEVSYQYDDKGDLKFEATNHSQRPYFVVLEFRDLVGTCTDTPGFAHRVEYGKEQLCTVKPNQGSSPFSSYSYRFFTSDPSAKIDPDYPYLIPVKNGTSTEVFQVSNISSILGKSGPTNWYCMGFNTNAGDTIYASRGGIVVENKMSIKEKDRDVWYSSDYNYVIILHDDGTVARYSQLENNKVFPQIGDKIIASQPIGIASAGNSQTRSHVYLLVYHVNIKTNESDYVLTKFCVSSIKPEILLPNTKYTARHFPEVVMIGMSRKMKKKYLGE
ncbi:MAG: M23 family metallopeptidase [Bacteroidia bacterium]|nr:M23 family metallopeptidase [Bacteroidia bacterium]